MANWGIDTIEATTTTPNWTRAMGGTSPDLDNMVIKSVSIYVGTTHTQQIRLAVYSGGALATNPAGATLLYDYGVTSGTGTSTWLTITGPSVSLPKNATIWIVFRNNGGYLIHYASASPVGSDFQTARGRWTSVDIDGDETSSFPSTWPTDSGGSFSNFWYSIYLIYSIQTYGGIKFTATNSQYLESVSSFTPSTNSTVCFWVYMNSSGGVQRMMGCDNHYEIGYSESSGNVIYNDLYQASSGNFISIGTIDPSTWYHITCTRDTSNNATIYIDGVLDNTGSINSLTPSSNNMRIGHRTGATGEYFDGYLEDMRIYDRVLSAAEIATIYGAKGVDGIVYGLNHRWIMNEGPMDIVVSGSGSVKDRGLGSLNMTPSNSPVFAGTKLKFRRFV